MLVVVVPVLAELFTDQAVKVCMALFEVEKHQHSVETFFQSSVLTYPDGSGDGKPVE
jgi:hypothetical protein